MTVKPWSEWQRRMIEPKLWPTHDEVMLALSAAIPGFELSLGGDSDRFHRGCRGEVWRNDGPDGEVFDVADELLIEASQGNPERLTALVVQAAKSYDADICAVLFGDSWREVAAAEEQAEAGVTVKPWSEWPIGTWLMTPEGARIYKASEDVFECEDGGPRTHFERGVMYSTRAGTGADEGNEGGEHGDDRSSGT